MNWCTAEELEPYEQLLVAFLYLSIKDAKDLMRRPATTARMKEAEFIMEALMGAYVMADVIGYGDAVVRTCRDLKAYVERGKNGWRLKPGWWLPKSKVVRELIQALAA